MAVAQQVTRRQAIGRMQALPAATWAVQLLPQATPV